MEYELHIEEWRHFDGVEGKVTANWLSIAVPESKDHFHILWSEDQGENNFHILGLVQEQSAQIKMYQFLHQAVWNGFSFTPP